MNKTIRSNALALAALALCTSAVTVRAQSTSSGSMGDPGSSSSAPVTTAQANTGSGMSGTGSSYSLLPYTRQGYVGIDLGRTDLSSPCGIGAFPCDDPNITGHIYTGGLINQWAGAEIGYFRTANADRAGGQTRVQGLNLDLVLRAPMGAFNAYVKAGGVYGQAKVTSSVLSLVTSGKETGWGPSYSVGVGYDFLPNSGVVLDWTRNEVKFPGGGDREKVDTTSLGYVFRF